MTSIQARDSNGEVVQGVFERFGAGQSVAYTGTAGTIANPIGASNRATATLTSNNTNVSDGDTVSIAGLTYTFKTVLTPTAGEVLIGATADDSLLNLIRAINHTGTPGTDYANSGITAVAHPLVSAASSVTAHAFLLTALTYGIAPNLYPTSDTAATLSFGGSTFSGGITPSRRLVRVMATTVAFIAIGPAPTATTAGFPLAAGVPVVIALNEGDKVSAIRESVSGTLYVVELF